MKDTITRILLKILNILFLYNVLGTSYGCLFGIMLLSLQPALTLYIPLIGLIKWYGFLTFGVLIFNIKPVVKKKYEDPKVEMQLKYVREMLNEGKFSDKEKRAIWRDTLESVKKMLSDNTENTNPTDGFSKNLYE